MPQLDRIIIFPQIFWFCLVFICFYLILTSIFLPKFLQSFKIRKLLLNKNTKESDHLIKKLTEKRFFLKNRLIKDLQNIKNVWININFLATNINFTSLVINEKIAKVIYWNILYYDIHVLRQISIFPKNFNLKAKKK